MKPIKPRRQSWQGNPPPDKEDHKRFRNGMKRKGLLNRLTSILDGKAVHLTGRKERKAGATTCESGYLFFSKEAFLIREPWIVCFDAPGKTLRMIIRPIPTNMGSYDIIPKALRGEFNRCKDNTRWLQKLIESKADIRIARMTLDILKLNYKNAFYGNNPADSDNL